MKNKWELQRDSYRLPQYNEFEITRILLNNEIVLSIDDNANHIDHIPTNVIIPEWVAKIRADINHALNRYYGSQEDGFQRQTMHGYFKHPEK